MTLSQQSPHHHIYMIAGEASGDILGARLMKKLRDKTGGAVRFSGIGGAEMAEEGLRSLFPMETLSVMGVAEVLPRIPDLLSRMRKTVRDIEEKQPDVVITIDSPDFCFRVLKSVKRRGRIKAPLIHYVAPSVWAWRPERAKKVARFLNHLLALLPFEPPYFEKEGLACTFVGHPVMENRGLKAADGAAFRARHGIAPEKNLVCVLPGSRMSELKRMLPAFRESLVKIRAAVPEIAFTAATLPHLRETVESGFQGLNVTVTAEEKYDAFAAADAALATSGTVALELAAVGTPCVIGYRMNALNAFLAKKMIKTPYVSLPNIILGRSAVPELLLENCTAEKLAVEMLKILTDPAAAKAQKDAFADMRLHFSGPSPSSAAADVVMRYLKD